MGDKERNIHTEGGAYAEGNVTPGGDFVGRDKYVQYFQLDLDKLAETLRQALPPGDPLPRRLIEALQQFQYFHARLYEWKELHNCLNDVLYALGQFSRQVDRLDMLRTIPEKRSLARLWRPVAQKVSLLLDFAAAVKFITEVPFAQVPDGLQGPNWAVELHSARVRLDELLQRPELDLDELSDATFDFSDLAEKHMYLADKQLRATSGELYSLSCILLGKVSHE